MKATLKVHLSALVAMLFWGMSYIWSKQVFETLGPGTTVFFRLIISSAFLALLLYFTNSFQKIQKKHFKLFLLTSLFNPFLYFVGESYGLNLVSPTISAVIIATIPVFTPIATRIFTNERLTTLNIIGLLVSFTGIIVMLVDKNFTLTASPLGILFLFGAVISAIIYSLFLKKTTEHYPALTIVWGQNTIGIFYFLPLFLMETSGKVPLGTLSQVMMPLVLLGVFASSMAFVLFTYTVSKIGVSRSNIYTNLISVFTAFFSFLILGEQFIPSKIAGMLLVILGVSLSQFPKSIFATLKNISS